MCKIISQTNIKYGIWWLGTAESNFNGTLPTSEREKWPIKWTNVKIDFTHFMCGIKFRKFLITISKKKNKKTECTQHITNKKQIYVIDSTFFLEEPWQNAIEF